MKALTHKGPRQISYSEVADTPTGPDGAIIQVTAFSICDGDPHIYSGHSCTAGIGYNVGHEAVGKIAELGTPIGQTR